MTTRAIVLLSLFAILGIVYVWFFLIPDRADLQMAVVQRPPRPVTFVFNRAVMMEEVKVTLMEPGPPGAEDQTYERVVWHLVVNPDEADRREERDSVTYGRGMRGMKRAEGMPRRPEALRPGVTYTFHARTTDGDTIRKDFSPR